MGATGGCVGLPYAPVLQAPSISGGQVSLTWDAPGGPVAPVSYVLYAGSAPGRSDIASFDLGIAGNDVHGRRAARHLLPAGGRAKCLRRRRDVE